MAKAKKQESADDAAPAAGEVKPKAPRKAAASKAKAAKTADAAPADVVETATPAAPAPAAKTSTAKSPAAKPAAAKAAVAASAPPSAPVAPAAPAAQPKSPPKPAAPAAAPLIDTGLAARAAANLIGNRNQLAGDAGKGAAPRGESAAFKQLKQGAAGKPNLAALFGAGTDDKKAGRSFGAGGSTFRAQTQSGFNKTGVPRRTGGG